jgi:hypothetical protein
MPTPVIDQVLPTQLIVGSGATAITVYGSNLVPTPNFAVVSTSFSVLWNGTALTPLAWGNTGYGWEYIMAAVPADLLTTMALVTITVSNSTSTPALSNALSVSITNPPPPTLTSISPGAGPINTAATVALNGTGFTASSTVSMNGTIIPSSNVSSTLTLTGTSFLPGVAVTWNGSYRTTTLRDAGRLTVAIPASDLASAGSGSLVATNPGAVSSKPLIVTVQ